MSVILWATSVPQKYLRYGADPLGFPVCLDGAFGSDAPPSAESDATNSMSVVEKLFRS